MAKSCPDCGSEVSYTSRTVELLEGSCTGCGRSLILAAPSVVGEAARAATAAARSSGDCWECGGSLTFTAHPDRSVSAECPKCHFEAELFPKSDGADEEGEEEAGEEKSEEEGPPRRPSFRRGREGPSGPPRGFPRGRPQRWEADRSPRPAPRPCRQCGGPIEISQNDDGSVTGTCGSCGNKFTMRPREEGRGFRDRPQWGGRPRSFSSRPGRPWVNRGAAPYDRRRRNRRSSDEE